MSSLATQHCAPATPRVHPTRGALVISLDFELYWGVRDLVRLDRRERNRLLLARRLVGNILEVFREFSVCATWATVGAMFADSRDEFEAFAPKLRPSYRRAALNPYTEPLGRGEEDDPFHYAPSLLASIANTPGQEIASHSFSHYYCLEPGQTAAQFEDDLKSATAIAQYHGQRIRSYVFPRNQASAEYVSALARHGVTTYRGVEDHAPYQATGYRGQRRWRHRALRMIDTFADIYGPKSFPWPGPAMPVNLKASRYLQPSRPWLRSFDDLKVRRILRQMQFAATTGQVFHLWWHPEDFATGAESNISALRKILASFSRLREAEGMVSLTMAEAAVAQGSIVTRTQ